MSMPIEEQSNIVVDSSSAAVQNMSIQELNVLILKLEEEVNKLKNLVNVLTIAAERFQESKNCLKELTTKANEIQVPLTSLVYVPGKIANPEKVLVAIGTGYYIEMSTKKADEFYDRKIGVVEDQLRKLQTISTQKNRTITQIYSILDHKLSMLRNAQANPAAQTT